MATKHRPLPATAPKDGADRLNLPPLPEGVREVVLEPRETLRYRRKGRYWEGTLYRLRRPSEQGEPVLRFANRRESLAELVAALWLDAEPQAHQQTVLWYLESIEGQTKAAS